MGVLHILKARQLKVFEMKHIKHIYKHSVNVFNFISNSVSPNLEAVYEYW